MKFLLDMLGIVLDSTPEGGGEAVEEERTRGEEEEVQTNLIPLPGMLLRWLLATIVVVVGVNLADGFLTAPRLHLTTSHLLLPPQVRSPLVLGPQAKLWSNPPAATTTSLAATRGDELVGEDAAVFDLRSQEIKSWGIFGVLLVTVLAALYVLWINPDTGFGDEYVRAVESISSGPEMTVGLLLTIFGIAHSGLASLRPKAEEVIGARAWRVVFALVSLPLAVSAIIFFINHRYDGLQLWDVKTIPGMHEFVWITSYLSFFFLYPSTFNLLEIAAVDKPKLHMWATGIMRITRHPQMVGQGMWCLAHSLWMGNTVVLSASLFLMLHHLFGCWNGDRRLRDKYGEAFDRLEGETSVLPFQAIIEGRQELPPDYYKEFLRVPYLIIAVATVGAYLAHPFMQAGSWTTHV